MLEVGAMDMTPKYPAKYPTNPKLQPRSNQLNQSPSATESSNAATTSTTTQPPALQNRTAAIGGHTLDVCSKFMPSLTFTSSDPTSLTCAACGCHHNFHRRDPGDSSLTSAVAPPSLLTSSTTAEIEYQPHTVNWYTLLPRTSEGGVWTSTSLQIGKRIVRILHW